jgi:uncharacterized membrane protein
MATATLIVEQRPGDAPVLVAAHFDGDGEYLPIEAPRSSLRVVKESTSVRWFDDVGPSGRHHRVLAAQLRDNDGHPVHKRTVAFIVTSEAGSEKCWGVTDAGGIARCKVSTRAIGSATVSMFFSGDAYYESATGSRTSATISSGSARVTPPMHSGVR